MFTFETAFIASAFIRQQSTGFVTDVPAVTACLVEFDGRGYHNALFAQLSIPLPGVLSSAVAKRRADYLSGRYAARQLLMNAGCRDAVAVGPDRAPVWPAGWCGSISHTGKWAIAVLSPQHYRVNPGVDIERLQPEVMREIATTFTTPDERALLAKSPLPYETALLITFSAKESLFKALFPQVQHMFGFEAAWLCELNPQQNAFTLQLTRRLAPRLPAGYRVRGRYLVRDSEVITLILAPAAH
ncbi:4'-phosphopantetheinyl transferase superfamily protein [Serratia plymuthica]|uniref:4'-phosphopantetheinyl transferase family protein n=1 Tax=Serratia plymuthica TaxID=82996 RepID=UPI001F53A32D|nr:4'-phosphopantetheinyl transferase superfamily protein [Serratia plymuthica]UNK28886.1 4'-phosphopantetheinyl transferase superfamily protein [Serratia plymuthica]